MNKKRIDEYYNGDPDSIFEYGNGGEFIRRLCYDETNAISFGFFQTSLDGGKEFLYDDELSHYEICRELADKIIGKAIADEDVDDEFE